MDLSFIIEDVVKEGIAKAKEAYRLLVDLHEHLMVKKVQIANTEIEDEEYLGKADNDWYEVVRLKAAYESQSKEKKPEVLAGGSSSVSAGKSRSQAEKDRGSSVQWAAKRVCSMEEGF